MYLLTNQNGVWLTGFLGQTAHKNSRQINIWTFLWASPFLFKMQYFQFLLLKSSQM